MTYVIVGYKDNHNDPVHRAQVDTNIDCLIEVAKCFTKEADNIIIRRIP